ncbi:exo-alpha-sialidase [bacterium]|nr:MAG: exo-alpha-sialidase [bacterium]
MPTAKGLVALPGGDLLGVVSRDEEGKRVLRSTRGRLGGEWKSGRVAATRELGTDIGDGNLIRLLDGRIWVVFRDNHKGSFAVRISESRDLGETWREHSTVIESKSGLWAPTLFRTRAGRILCVYDDEGAPTEARHQWLMGRFWEGKGWSKPFVVSAAPKGQLSRDGMAWLTETSDGRLLCAFEGVTEKAPYASLLRTVESIDGGRTWGGRRDLFRPKEMHMAVSPTLATMPDGTLVCAFTTDEDREKPDVAGTPPHLFNMDVKLIRSRDGGRIWSKPETVFDEAHRCYMPSLVLVEGRMLVTWVDFARGPLGRFLSVASSPALLPDRRRDAYGTHR